MAHFKKHGLWLHPLYHVWRDMVGRCIRKSHHAYARYGGRGITVCDRWKNDPHSFIADMGPRPPGMTLERKDNSAGYFPYNCEWANRSTQNNNRRTNIVIEHEGLTLTAAQWADKIGIPRARIYKRIEIGMPTSKILVAGKLPLRNQWQ